MLRPLAALSLSACDSADEPRPAFAAGEVIVSLKAGVAPDAFRTYVEADPELAWKEVIAETVSVIVLLGVPEGAEEATAARLESEATEFVASASVNGIVYGQDRP